MHRCPAPGCADRNWEKIRCRQATILTELRPAHADHVALGKVVCSASCHREMYEFTAEIDGEPVLLTCGHTVLVHPGDEVIAHLIKGKLCNAQAWMEQLELPLFLDPG